MKEIKVGTILYYRTFDLYFRVVDVRDNTFYNKIVECDLIIGRHHNNWDNQLYTIDYIRINMDIIEPFDSFEAIKLGDM